MKRSALLLLCIFGFSLGSGHAVSFVGFAPGLWGAPDATLGVAGYTIENFEDTALASGLSVQVISPSLGSYGPVTTLPFTYDQTKDCCSGVFNNTIMWDGTHALLNRPSVPIPTYANDGGWSDVNFFFAGGASSVGFSVGQADFGINIYLDLGNGFFFAGNSASWLSHGGGRNGYLRIDAGPNEVIYGVSLDNQAGNHDGILYDHLAFSLVPVQGVPDAGSTGSLLGVFLCAAMGCRRFLSRR